MPLLTTDLINQKATQASATLCPGEDISPDELKNIVKDWLARDERAILTSPLLY